MLLNISSLPGTKNLLKSRVVRRGILGSVERDFVKWAEDMESERLSKWDEISC